MSSNEPDTIRTSLAAVSMHPAEVDAAKLLICFGLHRPFEATSWF